MADRLDLLRRVPVFAELDRRELESVARTLRERTFSAGQRVTQEGQGGVGFFVIEEGDATVDVGGAERRKLGRGDYFGEIALILGGERTATVTADSELRCLGMTSWEFRPLVESNPRIAWPMIQAIAKRIGETGR